MYFGGGAAGNGHAQSHQLVEGVVEHRAVGLHHIHGHLHHFPAARTPKAGGLQAEHEK
jgi:uncharacterized membrane protein